MLKRHSVGQELGELVSTARNTYVNTGSMRKVNHPNCRLISNYIFIISICGNTGGTRARSETIGGARLGEVSDRSKTRVFQSEGEKKLYVASSRGDVEPVEREYQYISPDGKKFASLASAVSSAKGMLTYADVC
jgi:hypothetical protein